MPVARRNNGFRAIRLAFGILACLAVSLVAGCSGNGIIQKVTGTETGVSAQPNIIFVLTDDLDFASAYKMPELRSSLLEEGASFENDFVSFPLCCPSRATILTGLYAHNHNVKSNGPPDGGFQKFRSEGLEENTIAVRLQEAGYQTAFFGKYLNSYPDDDPTYVPPGWDEWQAKLNANRAYNYRINENGQLVRHGNEPEDYYTDVLSGEVTDFIRSAASGSEPFFMYVAPTAPHSGTAVAQRHRPTFRDEEAPRPQSTPSFDEADTSDKPSWIRNAPRFSDQDQEWIIERNAVRLRTMLAVDEMVGSLVEELEATGELDNTFVFFTSDNGWQLGEHRISGGKDRPYEESVRVPLFVRGPGVAAGSKVEELALNTDLAPTFADLAGIGFSGDGRSLVPLLRGEEYSWRSAILLEDFSQGTTDDETDDAEEESLSPPPPVVDFESVRTETHKYVEYDNGERELYDLKADPNELENIYEIADPSLLEGLRTKLDALRNCAGDGCREAEDAQ